MSQVEPEKPATKTAVPAARCSICGTRIGDDELRSACPDCLQAYHQGCWDEIGGCATYGCKSAAVAQKPPQEPVHGGWGDEKVCPVCEDSIASSLLVCHCGARFPWADPMTRAELDTWRARERQIESAQKVLVALFVLSLAGVGAPICGPLAAYYAHARRTMLVGAHGVYLAMGYGAAALGAAYVGAALVLAFAW
jgi:hypothetical protein